MCKKFKFVHTNKWYTHNSASVLENDTHTNGSPNLSLKTRPYNNQPKTRICKIMDFAVPTEYRLKLKESEKQDKYFDLARELKKLWNLKVTIVPIMIGAFGTVTKGLLKGLEDLECVWRTTGDYPNYGTIENGQNTEKSPRDLKRLAVTVSSERPSTKTNGKYSQ